MRGYPTFAEALEHALDGARDDAPKSGDRFVYLPASAAPFVFVYSRGAMANATSRTADALLGSIERERGPFAMGTATATVMLDPEPDPVWASSDAQPAIRPPVPAHVLTPEQEEAVAQMSALGAPLRGDFTAPEVRRAFCRLARIYHPDRHPDTSPEELAHLNEIFADLAEHYRLLMRVFER